MPILGAAAVAAELDPKLLLIPAALSASCAFMLPVATIPNAVVFGTGKISIKLMAGEPVCLNLIGAGVVTGVIYFCFLAGVKRKHSYRVPRKFL